MLKRESINLLVLALLATLAAFNFFVAIPWWSYLIVVLAWFLITVLGSFLIQWNYHLSAVHSKEDSIQNHIALTFDDGPDPEFTPKVLALLKQYNARATFFLIGRRAEEHPEIVMDILRQ